MKVIVLSATLAITSVLIFSCAGKHNQQIVSKSGLRVAIVGNTFAERMKEYNYFETLLYASFPNDSVVCRNFGWSGDEVNFELRPLNSKTTEEHLSQFKPDVIIACYGMNESFGGKDSLDSFKKGLFQLVSEYRNLDSDQTGGPQIVFVSPVAHEALPGLDVNADNRNGQLEAYTEAMADVAEREGCLFVDLFDPILEKHQSDSHQLTINGIHLNDHGYKIASEQIALQLALPVNKWSSGFTHLKSLVDIKSQQFFYHYRAVNSEYIVGRRKEPWVQPPGGPISYPTELAALEKIVLSLDTLLWSIDHSPVSNVLKQAEKLVTNCIFHDSSARVSSNISSLMMKDGFSANLFASEGKFPLQKPVKITFDPKGRMWVATMTSYPQHFPGCPPNDKILILEDVDSDGTADKCTVFADSLYMPLSFELGYGGVFVSQPPNLVFLRDTNNDDKADFKEVILHGFGTEDVHHSISAFTWGQDGALYMHSGTFLHSQVETPYGLIRNAYGETYRYEPRTRKLDTYISYPYANPWGNVFMKDGTHLVGDVSTGMNYLAAPLTTATEFPFKHLLMKDFLNDTQKPKTCGMEIVSSRQFPEEMQGNVLFNTFIGFQGITSHRIKAKGSGIEATKEAPLLQSRDPNFRPVDLQFGPDGALYVADWYNPIINHGERALRDPLRDKIHGRIWRITYNGHQLSVNEDLTKLEVPELLQRLRTYEDRVRYRVRVRLTDLPREQVLQHLDKWLQSLPADEDEAEMLELEGLWIFQQCNAPNEKLLKKLLSSPNSDVRAAATRVLSYWRDQFSWSEDALIKLSRDNAPKVRLYAVVALSHIKNLNSLNAILSSSQLPTDDYLNYAINESIRHLSPIWKKRFEEDRSFLADQPAKAKLLLSSLADSQKLLMPPFLEPDPRKSFYERKELTDSELNNWKDNPVVSSWRRDRNSDKEPQFAASKSENQIELSTVPGRMAFDKTEIKVEAGEPVTLLFINSDDMAHNVVITKPGSEEKVGTAADKMSLSSDGYEKNFVPELPDVLFYTPLVSAGDKYQLKFTAPKVPGSYPFLCTFPGHWRIMRGILQVEK